jgi:hypothetical protein
VQFGRARSGPKSGSKRGNVKLLGTELAKTAKSNEPNQNSPVNQGERTTKQQATCELEPTPTSRTRSYLTRTHQHTNTYTYPNIHTHNSTYTHTLAESIREAHTALSAVQVLVCVPVNRILASSCWFDTPSFALHCIAGWLSFDSLNWQSSFVVTSSYLWWRTSHVITCSNPEQQAHQQRLH